MSTSAAHQARRRAGRLRPARALGSVARSAYNVVRPVVAVGLLLGGSWLVWDELRLYPWHHNMPVWAFGLLAAGVGTYGLFQQVACRVRFDGWARDDNPRAALERAPSIGKMVRVLPPWYRTKYLRRRAELRNPQRVGRR